MKKIDLQAIPPMTGSNYPPPHAEACGARSRKRLAAQAGITSFGVNLTTLAPGAWSSQRHWHDREDEMVWVLEGELVLITDAGEEILRAGDCAAFRAGEPDAHHLVNRTDRPVRLLEIGINDPSDRCVYPDIDLRGDADGYTRGDGTRYPAAGEAS